MTILPKVKTRQLSKLTKVDRISFLESRISELEDVFHLQQRIVLSNSEGKHVIRLCSLIRCEACGGYTKIFVRNNEMLFFSISLGRLLQILPISDFLRVHQSHIINKNFITRYTSKQIEIESGELIPMSRRMRRKMKIEELLT